MVELDAMAGPPQPDKLCPSCGQLAAADANVCSNCGYNFNTGPFAKPPAGDFGAYPPPPGVPPQPGIPPQGAPNWQANYPRGGYDQQSTGAADGMAIASLVLGIISLPLFCIWCLGLPCGLLAIIFGALGLKGRYRALAISGIVCAGIGMLLALGFVALAASGAFQSSSSSYPFR